MLKDAAGVIVSMRGIRGGASPAVSDCQPRTSEICWEERCYLWRHRVYYPRDRAIVASSSELQH